MTGEFEVLDLGGVGADRSIEGQRSVENAAGNLAAIGHLAECGCFHRGWNFGVHRFDGGEQRDLGLGDAEGMGQVDRVLHDVNLVFEFGLDVDGGVGDEQGARVGRRIHDEYVGDAARGAQAGVALHGDFHQLVGVQAALHHGLGAAAAAHADADLGGFGFGVRVEDGVRRDVDADLCGQGAHGGFVADERGLDESLGSGFDGAAQGDIGERPADGGGDSRQGFAAVEKLVKDMIVGGVTDQRIDDNCFGKRGEIAHEVSSPRPAPG